MNKNYIECKTEKMNRNYTDILEKKHKMIKTQQNY